MHPRRPVRTEDGKDGLPGWKAGHRRNWPVRVTKVGPSIPPTTLTHLPLDSLCLSFFPSME